MFESVVELSSVNGKPRCWCCCCGIAILSSSAENLRDYTNSFFFLLLLFDLESSTRRDPWSDWACSVLELRGQIWTPCTRKLCEEISSSQLRYLHCAAQHLPNSNFFTPVGMAAATAVSCSHLSGRTDEAPRSYLSLLFKSSHHHQGRLLRQGSLGGCQSVVLFPTLKALLSLKRSESVTKYQSLATSVTQREVESVSDQQLNNLMTDAYQNQRSPAFSASSPQFQFPRKQLEVIESLDSWAQTSLLPMLKPVEKCWQPQDYLPDASSESFCQDVKELQLRARELPDDYLVCLVGDMITEEALPTYQSVFNTFEGVRDQTGCSPTPWGVWVRAWTAEENRHGDLLNKYLFLSGRVDMKMVERTTQHLIGSGMEPRIDNSPYNGFIYTSFQERATFISHGNTARHARQHGDHKLATICGMIAADEKRHEIAYTRIVEQVFERDPNGAMIAFEEMMRKKITMPAHLMFDGKNEHLFQEYASVAQRCGVYTSKDYAEIIEHLISAWRVGERVGLSSEAKRAQDYICNLPRRIQRLEDRAQHRAKKDSQKLAAFSWIFNRQVALL